MPTAAEHQTALRQDFSTTKINSSSCRSPSTALQWLRSKVAWSAKLPQI